MDYKLTVRNCDTQNPQHSRAYECLKPGAGFAHLLDRPNYRPSEDLFFAEMEGAIIGYINVLQELSIGRVVLDYRVVPSCSLEPVLTELLDRALWRARGLSAGKAHVSVSSTEPAQAELLSNLGFKAVRRYYELRLSLSEINPEVANRPDLLCRNLEVGEEEILVEIQNRCFAGTWGYNPNTIEDIAWRLKAGGNCLDDVILVWEQSKLIGYCWVETGCGQDLSIGGSRGRIYMLGVDPVCRGRGAGRRLLLAGLAYLKSKGREVVDITVDSQNVTAVTLYRSLGFRLLEETLWYEKVIS